MAVTAPINDDGTIQTSNDSYYHSTSSNTNNSSIDKDAFLQLLVAEMQNQDPLEPTSNTEYIAQLATFTQVEETQNMGKTMSKNLADSLVGKTVIMKTESSTGETGYLCGKVDYFVCENSKVYLSIDDSLYDIDDLDTVLDEDYYQNNIANKDTSATSSTETTDTTDSESSDDEETSPTE